MSLVERYVFRNAALAFFAGLAGLTAVIWLTQALRDFDLLTSKGQSALVFLAATGMVAPSLVMVIAPVALFGAIVFELNKLNGDSELIVMSAAGISPTRLLRPFLAVTLIATLVVGAVSLWLAPASFAELRVLLMKVRADFLSHVVQAGQFTTLDKGFVFHYRERAPGAGLLGVFMQDRRDPDHISTYIAETGITVEHDSQNYLVLEKGSIQRQPRGARDPAIVVFDRYAVDLAQFGAESEGAPLKPRERSTLTLLRPDPNDPYVQANKGTLRAELHDRIVNPLYAMAFGMIAFGALARPRTTRQGRGAAIGAALGCVAFVRIAGFAFAALAAKHSWAIGAIYATPLCASAAALWFGLGEPARLLERLRPRPRVALRPATA